mgnify:CR=1 FL=1|jgi:hypothetical protein
MNLYDIIESQVRFKLKSLRTEHENKRSVAFNKSFFDKELESEKVIEARKEYIT